MSLKVLKSSSSEKALKFSFQEFSGSEGDVPVFEGNTVNLGEESPLIEPDPLSEQYIPHVDIENMILKAEKDAEEIRKNAISQATQIEREAYEKGLLEGQKTGELLSRQKLETVLKRYHGSLKYLDELKDIELKALTLDIIDLVVFVAEKVVRDHITTHPGALVEMVREAVVSVKEKEKMLIYLNPIDCDYIKEHGEQFRAAGLGGSIQVEQDAQLTRGSVKIKTSYGDVDATVETQLNLIRKQVQNRLMELQ